MAELSTIAHDCPRCHRALEPEELVGVGVETCVECGGLWLEHDAFDGLYADRAHHREILRRKIRHSLAPVDLNAPLECPTCGGAMRRLSFDHRSGILIDICKKDGTWFDAGELKQIITYVNDGAEEAAGQHPSVAEAKSVASATSSAALPIAPLLNVTNEPAVTASESAWGWGEILLALVEILVEMLAGG